jgi:hypothetical protein
MTFSRGFPLPIANGDVFHLFNIGGIGTDIATYNARINDTILSLGAGGRMLYSWVLPDPWDQQDPEVDLPVDLTHISGVSFLDANGIIQRFGLASSAEGEWGDGWMVDTTRKTLRFVGSFSGLAHSHDVTVNGAKERTLPTLDTDQIDIHFDWLVLQTASNIMLNRPDQIDKNLGGIYQNRADSLRAVAVPPTPEGMIRVR